MSEENKEINKPDCSKMEYRYLGNSGLRVSVVGFGNWVNNLNDDATKECFKKALENGINFLIQQKYMVLELEKKLLVK